MKKMYTNFLFVSLFLVNPLSARINPQDMQTEIEAIKIEAEHEFAQAILFKYEADKANAPEKKNALNIKARKAIEKLMEMSNFLTNQANRVNSEKKSMHSSYASILPRAISDAKYIINQYVKIANSPTGY